MQFKVVGWTFQEVFAGYHIEHPDALGATVCGIVIPPEAEVTRPQLPVRRPICEVCVRSLVPTQEAAGAL